MIGVGIAVDTTGFAMICLAVLLTAAAPVDFNRDVRPILSARCHACHGRDDESRQADLRLDRRADAVESGAIVPGRAAESKILARVTHANPKRLMPPPKSGPALNAAEIDILRRWIDAGAEYANHWAFVPPRRPTADGPGRPIDQFVRAKLSDNGLSPSPPADRATLARRLSLDLIGLPPTPDEVAAFAADARPDAVSRYVDGLLQSPHFGERWARVWLDLARYADSAGYAPDPLRLNIWPYRDWVISAFNRNLPFDQFTIEQIAGDLLPNPTREQIMATAFHRNTMTNTEGGTDDEEFRVVAVKDRVNTTMQVWMGLTAGCAQCHTHKFDPISHHDYYSLFAVFNQTEDADREDEFPKLPLPTDDELKRKAKWKQVVEDRQNQLKAAGPNVAMEQAAVAALTRQSGPLSAGLMAAAGPLLHARQQLAAIRPVELLVMRERPSDRRRPTHVMQKGDFRSPGEAVHAGLPQSFHAAPPRADRLALAEWLVSRENPLTARVAVNRFWSQLFGTGLVETEEDFGTQGQPPSHPELLDWLAVEFMESGWDVKQLLKTIVLSETYQQSSRLTSELIKVDPRDRLLGRYPRRRLEAEAVRDQALALSGLLTRTIGGPSVYPPQPDGLWKAAFNGQRSYPTSTGPQRYRRGIYVFWRRTVPNPTLATFDAPSRETCTPRRVPTNTPLQAYVTLNDPVFVEASQALGRRVMREGGDTDAARAAWLLRLATGRTSDTAATETLTQLVDEARAKYRAEQAAAQAFAGVGGGEAVDAAAWTLAANVVLNCDAVLTRN